MTLPNVVTFDRPAVTAPGLPGCHCACCNGACGCILPCANTSEKRKRDTRDRRIAAAKMDNRRFDQYGEVSRWRQYEEAR